MINAIEQVLNNYVEDLEVIEEACQAEELSLDDNRKHAILCLLDCGLTQEQAEAALQNTKHPGGRPSGPKMPCGWKCGAKLTASQIRKHFTECPKRPAGVSK